MTTFLQIIALEKYNILTAIMAGLQKVLLAPVNAAVVLIVLPFVVAEHVLDGLSLLGGLGSLLRCDDRVKALKFITAQSTGEILKAKFPNSIAVRS